MLGRPAAAPVSRLVEELPEVWEDGPWPLGSRDLALAEYGPLPWPLAALMTALGQESSSVTTSVCRSWFLVMSLNRPPGQESREHWA